MRLPARERAKIKAEGLDQIARSRENEARKYLLAECFDNYIPLSPAESSDFERMQAQQNVEGKTMAPGWLEQGRVTGIRETLRRLLEKKFGPLEPSIQNELDDFPIEKIDMLLDAILDANSLDELGLGSSVPSAI